MKRENLQRLKYVVGDYLSSTVVWIVYTCLRYYISSDVISTQGYGSLEKFLQSPNVMLGIIVFPIMMMVVYTLSGYYYEVYRKSRVQEFFDTAGSVIVNAAAIFLVALINDMVVDRRQNYELLLVLVGLLFVCVYTTRACITNSISKKIKRRIMQFNTLVIGAGEEAVKLGRNLNTIEPSTGYNVVGYVKIDGEEVADELRDSVHTLDELPELCKRLEIRDLIVAPSDNDRSKVLKTISRLFALEIPIKITASLSDIILRRARLSQFAGDPLVDVSGCNMSDFTRSMKRFFDIVVSAVVLVLLIPVFIVLGIVIKIDSKGPIIYKQQRLGLHKRPFTIYKLRSMITNAEPDGQPQLTKNNDSRITRVGRVLRKYRLDELPQFFNVLIGDMSLVGPRPERAYYINQLVERVPYCTMLYQIRPGLTSLGMVKYGYANNVDQMIERLSYDLMYLDNMSISNDIKIIIYTVKVVVKGVGV